MAKRRRGGIKFKTKSKLCQIDLPNGTEIISSDKYVASEKQCEEAAASEEQCKEVAASVEQHKENAATKEQLEEEDANEEQHEKDAASEEGKEEDAANEEQHEKDAASEEQQEEDAADEENTTNQHADNFSNAALTSILTEDGSCKNSNISFGSGCSDGSNPHPVVIKQLRKKKIPKKKLKVFRPSRNLTIQEVESDAVPKVMSGDVTVPESWCVSASGIESAIAKTSQGLMDHKKHINVFKGISYSSSSSSLAYGGNSLNAGIKVEVMSSPERSLSVGSSTDDADETMEWERADHIQVNSSYHDESMQRNDHIRVISSSPDEKRTCVEAPVHSGKRKAGKCKVRNLIENKIFLCFFCKTSLTGGLKVMPIALNKSLPSSSLDPVSLLQCFGMQFPFSSQGKSAISSPVDICGKCYTLTRDCDVLYPHLYSVVSKVLEVWPEKMRGRRRLAVNVSFPENEGNHFEAAHQNMTEDVHGRIDQGIRKRELFTPDVQLSFSYTGGSHVILNTSEKFDSNSICKSKVTSQTDKDPGQDAKKISARKAFTCEFCSMSFFSERDWSDHLSTMHKIIQKWLSYSLQVILKRCISKELLWSGRFKARYEARQKYGVRLGSHRCYACTRDFLNRTEFVDHLHQFHKMDMSTFHEVDDQVQGKCKTKQKKIGNISQGKYEIHQEEMDDQENMDDYEVMDDQEEINDQESPDGQSQANCRTQKKELGNDTHTITNSNKKVVKVKTESDTELACSEGKCKVQTKNLDNAESVLQSQDKNYKGKKGFTLHWRCEKCTKLLPSYSVSEKDKNEAHHEMPNPIKNELYAKHRTESSLSTICPLFTEASSKMQMCCKVCNENLESEVALKEHIKLVHKRYAVNLKDKRPTLQKVKKKLGHIVILEPDGHGGVTDHRVKLGQDIQEDNEVGAEQSDEKNRLETTESANNNEEYTCNTCGVEFSSRNLMIKHISSVHDRGDVNISGANEIVMIECELCNRRLMGKQALLNHMGRTHPNHRKRRRIWHKCKMCNFQSHLRSCYRKHMKEKHDIESESTVQCHFCGKTYLSCYINRHIANIHEKFRKYLCKLCNMKFNDVVSLKCHIYFDHANKKWKCEKCDMEFDRYHRLRQHRYNVHKNEVHKCSQCDKTFKRKGDLTVHIKRTHETIVRSVCKICSRSYKARSKLRKHLIDEHGVPWEKTLSKTYAVHKQANNCLQRRSVLSENKSDCNDVVQHEETEPILNVLQPHKSDVIIEVPYKDSCSKEDFPCPEQQEYLNHSNSTFFTQGESQSVEDILRTESVTESQCSVEVTELDENVGSLGNISYIIVEEAQD